MHQVNSHDRTNCEQSLLRFVSCKVIDIAQVQEGETDDGDEHTNDVSLASPLPSLAPHKVLTDHNLPELVLLKFEPWHIIEH